MAKVRKAEKVGTLEEECGRVGINYDPSRADDAQMYSDMQAQLWEAFNEGKITSIDLSRLSDVIDTQCKDRARMSIGDAANQVRDPIERFRGLMESGIAELEVLKPAIEAIDEHRATAEEKKRWIEAVEQTIRIQTAAREDVAKFWVYVGRDQEATSRKSLERRRIFRMQKFHVKMFDAWSDETFPNSLMLAPPGHGKSNNIRGFAAWYIGHHPQTRMLMLFDVTDKARKSVNALKRIIESPRYKAIFPDIRLLGRTSKVGLSQIMFTVACKGEFNVFSREATVEGYAIRSQINGSGYDMVIADDICVPEVRTQNWDRQDTNDKWDGVIKQRLRDPSTSQIKIIATPWHEDDVYARIKKDYRNGYLANWRIDEFPIEDDELGEAIPLWPEKLPTTYLESQKARRLIYACLYRLDPGHKSTQLVRNVHYYNAESNNTHATENDRRLLAAVQNGERWLTVDPSGSNQYYSCQNGIIEISITANDYAFIIDAWGLDMSTGALKEWLIDRIISTPPPGIYGLQMEGQGPVAGFVSNFLQDILKALKDRGYEKDLVVVQSNTRTGNYRQNVNKEIRLRDSSHILETGKMRFPGRRIFDQLEKKLDFEPLETTGLNDLRDQVLHFRSAAQTDLADALSQFILQNRQRLNAAGKTYYINAPRPVEKKGRMEQMLARAIDSALEEPDRYEDEAAFMHASFVA